MQEVVLSAQRVEGFDISKDENKRESRPAAIEARRILHDMIFSAPKIASDHME